MNNKNSNNENISAFFWLGEEGLTSITEEELENKMQEERDKQERFLNVDTSQSN